MDIKNIRNILFIISGMSMTTILSIKGTLMQIVLGIILSGVICGYLAYGTTFFSIIFGTDESGKKKFPILSALMIGLITVFYTVSFYLKNQEHLINSGFFNTLSLFHSDSIVLFSLICGGLSFFCIFAIWLFVIKSFFSDLLLFYKSFNRFEWVTLLLSTCLFSLFVIIIYSKTSVFFAGIIDVVYTTDSGIILKSNAFLNISSAENDLRQPLFGVFNLPIGILATSLSYIFSFIPNILPILLAIFQIFALNSALIALVRLAQIELRFKLLLILMLFSSYPYLLFIFNIEQYVMSVTWLIFYIYSCMKGSRHKEVLFYASTGSLLTSGFFVFLLEDYKKLKVWIINVLKASLGLLGLMVLFGQMHFIMHGYKLVTKYYIGFTGIRISMIQKFYQYTVFVKSCFLKPQTVVDNTHIISYRLVTANWIDVIGVMILIIAAISFIIHRKDKFIKICFAWIMFSSVLLFLVGWGTKENGLIIYTLYFSWAFIYLTFMFFYRIFSKPVSYTILAVLIVFLWIYNIQGMLDLIKFGLENYPVQSLQ